MKNSLFLLITLSFIGQSCERETCMECMRTSQVYVENKWETLDRVDLGTLCGDEIEEAKTTAEENSVELFVRLFVICR